MCFVRDLDDLNRNFPFLLDVYSSWVVGSGGEVLSSLVDFGSILIWGEEETGRGISIAWFRLYSEG